MNKSFYYFISKQPFKQLSVATAEKVAKFHKRLLPEGKLRHPLTEKIQEFTKKKLELFARCTNEYIENTGLGIPFPDDHDMASQANMGYWDNFIVEQDETSTHWLAADVSVPLPEHVRLIGKTIKSVSVLLEYDFIDANEVKYEALVFHCCATEYPVVLNQGTFQKLSRIQDQHKEKTVDLKALAVSLGLPETATEQEVQTALDKKLSRSKELETANKALEDAKQEIEDTKTGKDKELSALNKKLENITEGVRADKLSAIKETVLKETGKPVPADTIIVIEGLLSANNTAAVALLVDNMLSASPKLDGKRIPVDPNTDIATQDKRQKENVMALSRILTSSGFDVKTSEDGMAYSVNHKGTRPAGIL